MISIIIWLSYTFYNLRKTSLNFDHDNLRYIPHSIDHRYIEESKQKIQEITCHILSNSFNFIYISISHQFLVISSILLISIDSLNFAAVISIIIIQTSITTIRTPIATIRTRALWLRHAWYWNSLTTLRKNCISSTNNSRWILISLSIQNTKKLLLALWQSNKRVQLALC